MSRKLSASFWDDDMPGSEEYDEWDEDLEQEFETTEADEAGAAVAAHRSSVYRELFIPSLTHHVASANCKRKKGGRKDLTHTLFAAMELDRCVSDVAEEIECNAAQEEHESTWRAVSSVVERLVAVVQLEVETEQRHQQQCIEDRTLRPMCASPTFAHQFS